ncbi:MAG: O-antigen ligase family protein [Acidobacteriia bacterium]|nr:O-antigen ligase family protein [Terriglobia bacterium]
MTLVLIIDAVVICLILGCAFLKGLERTLPLIAFLLMLFPYESQVTLTGYFDLTTQRLIVILTFLLYVFSSEAKERGKLPLRNTIFFLMAWMLIASAFSVVFVTSIKSVLSEFFDFFLIYYIFAKSITRTETVRKIMYGFVASMVVCSLLGIAETYWNWSVMGLFPEVYHRFANLLGAVPDRSDRVQTTFGHAILFGAALAMTIPMGLYLISVSKTAKQKVFLWTATMLMILNLYKTTSRGPWLAAALSMAVVLLSGGRQIRRYVMWIGALAVIALLARPGIWETIANLYSQTLTPESVQGSSYEWRYALYDQAFLHLNHDFWRALWGYGPESFFFLGWKGLFQGQIVPFESCDSSIAQLMIETGYVGFLLAISVFLIAGYKAFRYSLKIPKPANLPCVVLFVNICAFVFLMTNVAILGWGQQSYMAWIVIAMAMIYPGLLEKEGAVAEEPATESPVMERRLAEVLR